MGFVKDEMPWCGGRVSKRVLCLRADNPSPMTYVGTNTWIVAEPGADSCVVIDPAPAGKQVRCILEACDREGLRIGAIVATHDHPDHIEGIPELVAATGAPVYAPRTERIVRLLQKNSAGKPPFVSQLQNGSFCPFDGAPEFEVVSLPGHSDDSVGLLLSGENALFTGDVLFRHGPTVVFHPDGVLASYFASLDALETMVHEGKASRFYPGHGYPINDPLPIIQATRQHRVDRLNQVREALAAGTPAEPDALFDVVYKGVDPALRMPSIRSIRAQLEYLGAS